MKTEWTPSAIEDRNSIYDYIEQHNPQAALDIDQRISDQISILPTHPMMGRSGRIPTTRELIINKTEFIATYQILDQGILVLHILHSRHICPFDL